jgi:hypothetical protein
VRRWFQREKRSPLGLATSVVVHLALVLLLAQLVFRYPLSALFGGYSAAEHIKPETVHYVRVVPPPPSSVRQPKRARPAPRGGSPAPLIAPSAIPTQPPPITAVTPRSVAAGANGNGLGVTGGAGIATGLVPALPDSRIRLAPGYFALPTKTPVEKIDSIIADAYGEMLDSLEAASQAQGRAPGDWTVTKDGKKYGWDPEGIRLGKFMIPNALLALLPLHLGVAANPSITSRYDEGMREDLLFHERMSLTEDEFEQALKRIRARNEKIHEAELKARQGASADSSSNW